MTTLGWRKSNRFWGKVDKRGSNECWPWLGRLNPKGYGSFDTPHGSSLAHRVAYVLSIGPIPEGFTLDHVRARGCTRRDCCNPAHLEPVTQRVNVLRGDGLPAQNARKTHCPRGHVYDFEVRKKSGDKHRGCRACFRAANLVAVRRHRMRGK